MLLGQDRGGHQHGHLLLVHDGLERGPQRDLRLAVAHIAADQPVHGLGLLHVLLHLPHRLDLVRSLGVGEGGLQLLLPDGVRREGKTGEDLPGGVQLQQVLGHVPGGLPDPLLGPGPLLRSQAAQRRRLAARSDVPADAVRLIGGHVEHVPGGVLQRHVLPLHVAYPDLLHAVKAGDPVIDVDSVVTGGEVQHDAPAWVAPVSWPAMAA